ncbi:hypothetical protein FJZ31_03435 [Candidatus Poribacteria bacterium]|nr:hypothetical protein [Candidatus Poribacteria bacterium]
MSQEETREYQLLDEDLAWWTENSTKFFVDKNRGKHIAVVNKEPFFGDTYQEAKEKAIAKYPNRRFVVHYILSRRGKSVQARVVRGSWSVSVRFAQQFTS